MWNGNNPIAFWRLWRPDYIPAVDTLKGLINRDCMAYQEVFHQEGIVPKWQSKEIGDLMDNEITGWEKHGTHRFPGGLGIQRAWKRIRPKKDPDGFMKIDEETDLPFE